MILSGLIRLVALWYSLSLFRKGRDRHILALFLLIALSTVLGGMEVGRILATSYPFSLNFSIIMILNSVTQLFCVYLVDYLTTLRKESNQRIEAHAQQERQNQEKLLHLTLKSANIKILDWNPSSDQVISFEVDPASDELHMLNHPSLDAFLGTLGKGDTQTLRRSFQQAVEEGISCLEEYKTEDDAGQLEWHLANGNAYFNNNTRGSHFVGTIRPITARKKAFFQSAQFQEKLRLAAQSARLRVWEWDLKKKTIHMYSKDLTLSSSRPENAVLARVHPEDQEVLKLSISEATSTGIPLDVPMRYMGADGSYRWYQFYADTVLNEHGEACSFTGVFQDIHDQKSIDEQLKLSELRFRRAIDAGKLLVYDLNLQKNEFHTYASQQTQEYYIDCLGVSFDAAITFAEALALIHPDDHPRIYEIIENPEILQLPETTLRLKRTDGGIEWISISVEVIRNSSGQATVIQGFLQNTTEKRIAKAKLEQQAKMLDLVGQSIIVKDIHGHYLYVNDATRELFGVPEELEKVHELNPLPEDAKVENRKDILDVLEKGNTWTGEFTASHLDGTPIPVLLTATPLFDENGELEAIIGNSTDLRARLAIERQMVESQERLEMAMEVGHIEMWEITSESLEKGIFQSDQQPEKDTGKLLTEQIHPGQHTTFLAALEDTFEYGNRLEGEFQFRQQDETYKWYRIAGEPTTDEKGRIIQITGVRIEIDVLKRTLEELKASEERLRIAIEAAKMAIWEWKKDTDVISHYRSEKLNGIFPGLLPESPDAAIQGIHPEDQSLMAEAIRKGLENNQEELPQVVEYRMISPDGTINWFATQYQAFHDKEGNIEKAVGTIQTITHLKQAEETLRSRFNQLQALYYMIDSTSFAEDFESILKATSQALKLALKADFTAYMKVSGGSQLQCAFSDGLAEAFVERINGVCPWLSNGITETFWIPTSHDLFTQDDYQSFFENYDIYSFIYIPVSYRGEISGVLKGFYTSATPVSDDDLQLGRRIGEHLAFATTKFEAQKALKESEERFRLALSGGKSITWEFRFEDRMITYYTHASGNYLTKHLETFLEEIHPDDAEELQIMLTSIDDASPTYVQFTYREKDEEQWQSWDLHGEIKLNAHHEPVKIIGITVDITEKQQAEKTLQKRLTQLQAMYRMVDVQRRVTSLKEIYQAAHQGLKESAEISGMGIFLYDDHHKLLPAFTANIPPALSYHIEDTSATENRAPTHLTLPLETIFHLSRADQRDPREQFFTILPLWYQHKQLGYIVVSNAQHHPLEGEPLYLLQRIADHVAMAITQFDDEHALRESEARQRAILNALPDQVYTVSADGMFISQDSPGAYHNPDWKGASIFDMYPIEVAAPLLEAVSKALQEKQNQLVEYHMTLSNELNHYEARLAPAGTDEVLVIIRDITSRKRAEEELVARRDELLFVTENVPAIITRLDQQGQILFANRRAKEATISISGNSLPQSSTFYSEPIWQEKILEALETGQPAEFEFEREDHENPQIYSNVLIPDLNSPLVDPTVLAISQNITTQKRLQKEVLEITNAQQRRIGQDLHDELGQMLTGIGFRLESLKQDLTNTDQETIKDIASINDLVSHAIKQTRQLAEGLNPVTLDVQGIRAGLELLALNTSKLFNLPCTVTYHPQIHIWDEEVALHVYRIAQEAVNNAVKHAKPELIAISLFQTNDKATLKIEDNGKGITEHDTSKPQGMGLQIMKYRASMINGTFSVETKPDGGTRVTCTFNNEVTHS